MGNDNNNTNTNNSSSQSQNSNHNNNNNGKKGKKNNFKANSSKDKFKGKCKELNGAIFDANRFNQADEYIKTVKEIAEYVGSNYKDGADVKACIESGKKLNFDLPVAPEKDSNGNMDETLREIWKREIDLYVKKKEQLNSNLRTAYSLVWGQCTDVIREKLESMDNYKQIKQNFDVLGLLEMLKVITFKFEDQKYAFSSVYYANKKFYNYRQSAEDTNNEHYDKFCNIVSISESYGGLLGQENILLESDEIYQKLGEIEKQDENNIKQARTRCVNRYLAFCFISKADNTRYGELKTELENDYAKGNNNYPATINKALRMLTDRNKHIKKNKSKNQNEQSVSFNQKGKNNKNNGKFDDSWHKDATCHNCGEKGHIKPNCPKERKETANNNNGESQSNNNNSNNEHKEKQNFQLSEVTGNEYNSDNETHFSFFTQPLSELTQQDVCLYGAANNDLTKFILLDNQSTVDVFCNKDLLSNINPVNSTMTIETNGGTLTCNKKGYLKGHGQVWFHDKAITNILSLKNVKKKYRVTYDSATNGGFIVHKPDNKVVFKEHKSGLFIHDTTNRELVFVETVENNKQKYTERQYKRAVRATEVYMKIGCPSLEDFKFLIKHSLINNCPVTIQDVKIAEDIFGKNVHALKGKTTRKKPTVVVTDYIDVPPEILQIHKNVILCGDIFYVQGIPFFVTLSRNIKFNTLEKLESEKAPSLISACDHAINTYSRRGFQVDEMFMDMQFNVLREQLLLRYVKLNSTSANEHVGEIERFIRVIKERVRALYSRLPYNKLPKRITEAIVRHVCRWLNVFCPKNGIGGAISPRTLITGVKLDFNSHCRIEVGAYAQVHEENIPTNDTTKFRTTGAIALEHADNLQGGYKFLSLTTGRVLDRRNFDILPVTQDVIKRVHEMAEKEKDVFEFRDRNHNLIEDDDDSVITGVESDTDDDSEETTTDNSENENWSVQDNNNDQESVISDENEENEENNQDLANNELNEEDLDLDDEVDIESLQSELEQAELEFKNLNNDLEPVYEADNEVETGDDISDAETQQQHEVETVDEQEEQDNQIKTKYGRIVKPKGYLEYKPDFTNTKYESSNINIEKDNQNEILVATALEHVFNQYSLNKGLKKFGDQGSNAVFDELKQMHQRGAFVPRDYQDLTKNEKMKILDTIVLIEEKRDGRVKGRAVANGSKQRGTINKEDAASPTAALESIILTSIIDAQEHREVAVVDIPNAFIQTDVKKEDTVIMKLRGKAAELLVKTSPELYRKYITIENGKTVLYVEAWKAIYGTLKAALLFYKKLRADLESIGFTINPYDPCVANKMIKNYQFTIVWHVDDLKLSHKYGKEIDKFIAWLKGKYEDPEIGKIKVSRGKIHQYLGMTLDFTSPGEVKIDMVDYIKKMIEDFPDKSETKANTPAASHLFEVRDDVKLLDEEKAIIFHNLTARGLFVCKRARPDIQTTIAFLTSRVAKPDLDDWKKLQRLINYLRGTQDLVLTLRADNAKIAKWSVDVAYAVHKNFRSHTGGNLTLGKGTAIGASLKQKLNTKSSTEAEVVGTDDMMGQILWTNYFLEHQGYGTKDTILYQDNKSAILLEKNGKSSSGKRTKHMNIRYFFIKDRIDNGELKVEYCPTDDMVADFFTKPLQGSKFIKFRNEIMNIK